MLRKCPGQEKELTMRRVYQKDFFFFLICDLRDIKEKKKLSVIFFLQDV